MTRLECPTCERDDFASERGMLIHHKRSHGESLAFEERECVECGGVFEVYRTDSQKRCSEECKNRAHSESISGETNPNYRGKDTVTLVCEFCGSEHEYEEYEAEYRNYSLEYCRECESEYSSEFFSGDNHWNYSHGNGDGVPYGDGWRSIRKTILERDDWSCVVCEMSNERHQEVFGGKSLNVHHIVPRSEFYDGEKLSDEANEPDNLVSLCHKHHKQAEANKIQVER